MREQPLRVKHWDRLPFEQARRRGYLIAGDAQASLVLTWWTYCHQERLPFVRVGPSRGSGRVAVLVDLDFAPRQLSPREVAELRALAHSLRAGEPSVVAEDAWEWTAREAEGARLAEAILAHVARRPREVSA